MTARDWCDSVMSHRQGSPDTADYENHTCIIVESNIWYCRSQLFCNQWFFFLCSCSLNTRSSPQKSKKFLKFFKGNVIPYDKIDVGDISTLVATFKGDHKNCISHSPCPVVGGGTCNVKIIKSTLSIPYDITLELSAIFKSLNRLSWLIKLVGIAVMIWTCWMSNSVISINAWRLFCSSSIFSF